MGTIYCVRGGNGGDFLSPCSSLMYSHCLPSYKCHGSYVFRSDPQNCLLTTTPAPTVTSSIRSLAVSQTFAGEYFDADIQCRQTFGVNSFYCRVRRNFLGLFRNPKHNLQNPSSITSRLTWVRSKARIYRCHSALELTWWGTTMNSDFSLRE